MTPLENIPRKALPAVDGFVLHILFHIMYIDTWVYIHTYMYTQPVSLSILICTPSKLTQ